MAKQGKKKVVVKKKDKKNKSIDSKYQNIAHSKKKELQEKRGEIRNKLKQEDKVEALKFLRDPIHDLIKIERQVFLDVIDTFSFQRLRRIKQLGTTAFVFPGAEHSRFSHSLGAYYLCNRFINQLKIPDKYDRFVLQLAALLHDIGHGPFSHLFEQVLDSIEFRSKEDRDHEEWTKKIISKDKQLTKVLDKYGKILKRDICDVIDKRYYKKDYSAIVSSQFDIDRLDYMLRDSHMTGVNYGKFDLNWLIRCLSLKKVTKLDPDENKYKPDTICIDLKKGISVLEQYFLGNLYLYKHVYFHKTVQATDGMIVKILQRAFYLLKRKKNIGIKNLVINKIVNGEKLDVEDYCSLDDNLIWSWINFWAKDNKDKILTNLCRDLLNRDLFKVLNISKLSRGKRIKAIDSIEEIMKEKNLDPEFYLYESAPSRIAYSKLKPKEVYIHDNQKTKPFIYSDLKGKDYPVTNAIIEYAEFEENFLILPQKIYKSASKIIGKY